MPVNIYDQPFQAQYMNTYAPMPYQEILQAGAMRQQQYDTAEAMEEELQDNLMNISALQKDKTLRNELIAGYEEDITKKIDEAGGDYGRLGPYIKSKQRQFKKDVRSGELGQIHKNYGLFQEWDKAMRKEVRKGNVDQNDYERYKKKRMSEYMGVSEEGLQDIQLKELARSQEIFKDSRKIAKNMKGNVRESFTGWFRATKDPKATDNDISKFLWERMKITIEELTEDNITHAIMLSLKDDPKYTAYLDQKGELGLWELQQGLDEGMTEEDILERFMGPGYGMGPPTVEKMYEIENNMKAAGLDPENQKDVIRYAKYAIKEGIKDNLLQKAANAAGHVFKYKEKEFDIKTVTDPGYAAGIANAGKDYVEPLLITLQVQSNLGVLENEDAYKELLDATDVTISKQAGDINATIEQINKERSDFRAKGWVLDENTGVIRDSEGEIMSEDTLDDHLNLWQYMDQLRTTIAGRKRTVGYMKEVEQKVDERRGNKYDDLVQKYGERLDIRDLYNGEFMEVGMFIDPATSFFTTGLKQRWNVPSNPESLKKIAAKLKEEGKLDYKIDSKGKLIALNKNGDPILIGTDIRPKRSGLPHRYKQYEVENTNDLLRVLSADEKGIITLSEDDAFEEMHRLVSMHIQDEESFKEILDEKRSEVGAPAIGFATFDKASLNKQQEEMFMIMASEGNIEGGSMVLYDPKDGLAYEKDDYEAAKNWTGVAYAGHGWVDGKFMNAFRAKTKDGLGPIVLATAPLNLVDRVYSDHTQKLLMGQIYQLHIDNGAESWYGLSGVIKEGTYKGIELSQWKLGFTRNIQGETRYTAKIPVSRDRENAAGEIVKGSTYESKTFSSVAELQNYYLATLHKTLEKKKPKKETKKPVAKKIKEPNYIEGPAKVPAVVEDITDITQEYAPGEGVTPYDKPEEAVTPEEVIEPEETVEPEEVIKLEPEETRNIIERVTEKGAELLPNWEEATETATKAVNKIMSYIPGGEAEATHPGGGTAEEATAKPRERTVIPFGKDDSPFINKDINRPKVANFKPEQKQEKNERLWEAEAQAIAQVYKEKGLSNPPRVIEATGDNLTSEEIQRVHNLEKEIYQSLSEQKTKVNNREATPQQEEAVEEILKLPPRDIGKEIIENIIGKPAEDVTLDSGKNLVSKLVENAAQNTLPGDKSSSLKGQRITTEYVNAPEGDDKDILQVINTYRNAKYNMGDKNSTDSIDCSGFVDSVFTALGVNVSPSDKSSEGIWRNSNNKKSYNDWKKIPETELKPGTVIAFDTGDYDFDKERAIGIDHIGMIVKDASGNIMIAESSDGKGGVTLTPYKDRMQELDSKLKKVFIGKYTLKSNKLSIYPYPKPSS